MSWIRRIKHRLQPIAGSIDQTWSHDGAVGIRGWVIHKNGKIKQATVEVDGVGAAVTNWHPRPDIKKIVSVGGRRDITTLWILGAGAQNGPASDHVDRNRRA
jgi:hypothetical protein